jgi:uncharacterized protein (DUF4415 family)
MRKEYDFSDATRARDVPHLAKLRASVGDNPIVMIHLDADVVREFKQRKDMPAGDLEAWVNSALREWLKAHAA